MDLIELQIMTYFLRDSTRYVTLFDRKILETNLIQTRYEGRKPIGYHILSIGHSSKYNSMICSITTSMQCLIC